jgi:hypothetical protein
MSSVDKIIFELSKMGSLPDESAEIADGVLERYDELFQQIKSPLTEAEAVVIARLFPPVACFGMEWTIVHMLERSENWPSKALEAIVSRQWKMEMLDRIERMRTSK